MINNVGVIDSVNTGFNTVMNQYTNPFTPRFVSELDGIHRVSLHIVF